jgi:hypothetical protein
MADYADLTINFSTPGLTEAAAGMDKLGKAGVTAAANVTKAEGAIAGAGKAAAKSSDMMEKLQTKLRSGDVIRNTAASFALMGTASMGATEKVAALAGAMASLPGVAGLAAAAVAAGATIFSIYSKAADAAAAKVKALADEIEALQAKRGDMLGSVAARVEAARAQAPGLRAFAAQGGDPMRRDQLTSVLGGDSALAGMAAGTMAAEGLDPAGQARVTQSLKDARALGLDITAEVIQRTIAAVQDEYANWGQYGKTSAAELIATGQGLNRQKDVTAIAQGFGRMGTVQGAILQSNLAEAEAPAVTAAITSTREGSRGALSAIGQEAIRYRVTEDNTKSLDGLNTSIKALDTTIKGKQGEQKGAGGGGAPPASSGAWAFDFARLGL